MKIFQRGLNISRVFGFETEKNRVPFFGKKNAKIIKKKIEKNVEKRVFKNPFSDFTFRFHVMPISRRSALQITFYFLISVSGQEKSEFRRILRSADLPISENRKKGCFSTPPKKMAAAI